jgi:hypothetical protein
MMKFTEDKSHIIYANTLNRKNLAKKCAAGELTRVTRGVYADSVWYNSLEPRKRYIEIIRICGTLRPEIVIAGSAAAVLHGIDILGYPEYPTAVDAIITDWGKCFKSDKIRLHSGVVNNKCREGSDSVRTGIKFQSVADSLFFIMRNNSEAEAIVALHSALRQCSKGAAFVMKQNRNCAFPLYSQKAYDLFLELQDLIHKNESANGLKKAKRILYLATDHAESAGESISILYCYNFGLALPVVNPTLLDSKGMFLGRVDLFWNLSGAKIERRFRTDVVKGRHCRVLQGKVAAGDTVIVEFDGKGKSTDEGMRAGKTEHEVLVKEKNRENAIRGCRHGMIRIEWYEFYSPKLLYEKLITGGVPIRKFARKNFDVLI